jgi:hypothetical protein
MLGVQCPELFKAINDKASYIVAEGNPQEIATMGVVCPAFFKATNNRASYLVEQGNSQNIANMAWAFAEGWC